MGLTLSNNKKIYVTYIKEIEDFNNMSGGQEFNSKSILYMITIICMSLMVVIIAIVIIAINNDKNNIKINLGIFN